MCDKLSRGSVAVSRGLDVRLLPRTRALLLGLLLAAAAASCARAELEIDVVMMEVDGGRGGEGRGNGGESERRGELEASMHSSLLHDFREVTTGIRAMEEAVAAATQQQQNAAAAAAAATPPAAAFPDSSAVVGRIFQMKVPNKMEDVYLGDIVKISKVIGTMGHPKL